MSNFWAQKWQRTGIYQDWHLTSRSFLNLCYLVHARKISIVTKKRNKRKKWTADLGRCVYPLFAWRGWAVPRRRGARGGGGRSERCPWPAAWRRRKCRWRWSRRRWSLCPSSSLSAAPHMARRTEVTPPLPASAPELAPEAQELPRRSLTPPSPGDRRR